MFCGWKWFQERIFFAAAGVVMIGVEVSGASCVRLALLQWSGLSCEMSTRSGSSWRSARDLMHGWPSCVTEEKPGVRTCVGPVIQGSKRMVNEPGNRPGDAVAGAIGGEKVRRKHASPLMDLMVRGILGIFKGSRQQRKRS